MYYRGLGQSVEEFTQRRLRAAWAEAEGREDPWEAEGAVWGAGESQEVSEPGPQIQPESSPPEPIAGGPVTPVAGPYWPADVSPGEPIDKPEEDAATVRYQPTGTMFVSGDEDPFEAPAPAYTPADPVDTSGSGDDATQEGAGTVSNGVDTGPGAEDASSASSDPMGSGELVTITVQLRNAGNFNPPGANTKLRFTMPGLGGSICATGAAFGQLPAGTAFNTFILGEWQLTGQWGSDGSGCTFVVHSASETVEGYVDAISIPAQETPYTPGPDYCPPGQIPKSDGSGCYEPCPERSQRYDEATGQCVPIECPPGTIPGAYGLCVELSTDEEGRPIGIPVEEPPPDPIFDDIQELYEESIAPEPDEPIRSDIDPLLHCAPGWWAPEGVCVPMNGDVGPDFEGENGEEGGAEGAGRGVTQYDDPGTDYNGWDDSYRRDPGDEDPWSPGPETALPEADVPVIEPYEVTPEEYPQYFPPVGPVSTGYAGGGGAGPAPGPGAPLGPLIPADPGAGGPGDGFGIVGVAVAAGLAWVLSESYRRR